jgi:hypothetical protein
MGRLAQWSLLPTSTKRLRTGMLLKKKLQTFCLVCAGMDQPTDASTGAASSQAAQVRPPRPRAASLFSEPPGGVLPASAVVELNKPINGEIATMSVNGGGWMLPC